MGKKSFRICAAIIAVAMGALMYLNFWAEAEPEYQWDAVIEMANKNVTWTGAGYNGIFAGK